jgi:putative flippase GtrA
MVLSAAVLWLYRQGQGVIGQLQLRFSRLIQPAKFVFVGLINTGWSYLLYAAFLYLGLSYWLASFLTIILSVGFAFLTQGSLVFGGTSRQALPRFILAWVLIYVVYLLVVGTAQTVGVNNYVGGLVATPLVAVMSYVLMRRFVFAQP